MTKCNKLLKFVWCY